MEFPTEKDAEAYLERMLAPHFGLHRQVGLRHLDGHKLRIDYVAVPSVFTGFPAPVVGIEVKRGYAGGFKDFSAALKQCIDYRHAVIEDPRSTKFAGQVLKWVFLFPSFHEDGDPQYRTLDDGVERGIEPDQIMSAVWRNGCQFAGERFAGKFNVGFIRHVKAWDYAADLLAEPGAIREKKDGVEFRVSACRIWDSINGASRQSETWRSDRGRGSA